MSEVLTNKHYGDLVELNMGTLIDVGKIGLCRFNSSDLKRSANQYLLASKGYETYHFTIDIPYAGRTLTWEFIFNPDDFSELPDFNFNDPEFPNKMDIDYITNHVPSWDSWNIANEKSIINILTEFLVLYKTEQIEKLRQQNRLSNINEEYEDLLRKLHLSEGDVDVDVNSESVYFQINLPVDFSPLPTCFNEKRNEWINSKNNYALLNLSVSISDMSRGRVTVFFPALLEAEFGDINLSKFRPSQSLFDYARITTHLIDEYVSGASKRFNARQKFSAAIVAEFSSSIVEYDSNRFNKICFIYEDSDKADCLVIIEFEKSFPEGHPIVELHSIYCQIKKNCKKTLSSTFYKKSSDLPDNVQALKEMLDREVKTFVNHDHV